MHRNLITVIIDWRPNAVIPQFVTWTMSSTHTAHGHISTSKPPSTQPPPQQQQTRRRCSPCWAVVRALKYPAFVLLVPAILNYAALNRENVILRPQDGVQYDIGWGQKIFLHCKGNGTPTVILDAPIGETSDVWYLVQPLVSKHTTVCTYDRAGLGYSDRPYENTTLYAGDSSAAAVDRDRTTPYTTERMVDDLNRLLNYASNQPKPLLLVSSDYSTVISRFYTQLYEQDVAGLVLINPMAENLFTPRAPGLWPAYWYKHVVPQVHAIYLSGLLGFNRLGLMVGLIKPVELPAVERVLPDDVILRKKHFLCQPKHLSSVVDEYRSVATSMDQLRTLYSVKPFPKDVDITIATYDQPSPDLPLALQSAWSEGVETLLHVVHPNARHVKLLGADHTVFYIKPDVVANTIVEAVVRLRSHLMSPKE